MCSRSTPGSTRRSKPPPSRRCARCGRRAAPSSSRARLHDAAASAEPVPIVTTADAAHDALRSYLASGLLPWAWHGLGPPAALHQAAQSAAAGALTDARIREALLPAGGFLARLGALLRWLALIDAALRQRWVQAHRPRPPLARLLPAWPIGACARRLGARMAGRLARLARWRRACADRRRSARAAALARAASNHVAQR